MKEQIDYPSFEGLSLAEIQEINAEFSHYENKRAVSIEALKIIQKHRGWISDACLVAVAELLNIPSAQLEGVATFYNLIYRQPVGKTVIHYCNSVTCWMLGSDQVCERLCQHLNVGVGEMTANGEYILLPSVCLGACDHAPVVMVGTELKLDITENVINEIFGS